VRRVLLLAVLVVAALLLWQLRRAGDVPRARRTEAAPPALAVDPAGGEAQGGGGDRVTRAATPGRGRAPAGSRALPEVRARLVYEDGTAAAQVLLHLAVGRPIETTRFRNHEYPMQTVWLVTQLLETVTDAEGRFAFPPVHGPARARRTLYTDGEAPAFLIAEVTGSEATFRARRRVPVRFRVLNLRDATGLAAQLGRPEDYRTRIRREEDAFVGARGDLGIDHFARADASLGEDGTGLIRLVAGSNTLGPFGEVVIPPEPTDLGELRILPPPPAPEDAGRFELTVLVVDLAGRPNEEAEVQLWDGTVGPGAARGGTRVDERMIFDELRGPEVVAWATVPFQRQVLLLPDQGSGIVRLPCGTPVVLRVPREDELCWVQVRGVQGYFLFERDGAMLGGGALDEPFGVPPGDYRVYGVTAGGRILELAVRLNAGERVLAATEFTDTTWS